MRRILAVIAISTAALAATAAFPENVVWEQRAAMERLWDNSQARAAAPGTLLDRVFGPVGMRFAGPGPTESGSNYGNDPQNGNGPWSGNFRGGRVHEPAGH
ncbi:MAG: hypothetical protein ACE5EU_00435 [Paracoccaceae bacterium]